MINLNEIPALHRFLEIVASLSLIGVKGNRLPAIGGAARLIQR